MSAAYWLCAAITVVSALVSLGFSIAALRATTTEVRIASMYAFARSLALAIAAVIALILNSVGYLQAVALSMVIVQAADAVIGAMNRERLKTIGPAITALVNAVALGWLASQ